jgi:hypothetical protein
MAKVVLGLDDLTEANLIQLAIALHDGVVANAANFTGITPTAVQLQTALDDLQAKFTAKMMKEQEALSATDAKNLSLAALKAALHNFGMSAELVTGGDPIKLQDAGFPLAGPRQPASELGQVQNLSATFGDNPGELDLQWEPLARAKSYEVWLNLTPANPAGWVFHTSAGKSSITLTGLPSGQTCQVKVRGVGGTTGRGPYSDLAEHLIP